MSHPDRAAASAQPLHREAKGLQDEMTAAGKEALRTAKAGIEDTMTDVADKGREALKSVRDVRDTFADALRDSVETHPYATLAIAGAVGFFIGATWRR